MDKSKSPAARGPTAATPAPKPVTVAPALVKPPPLFRRIDWLTFAVTTLCVWVGYYFTLAPDLTLEDSGELAVASLYAGIPHPPGYPVWTIYTWLWTLLPFHNIAWRVALGNATAAAFACGMLGFLVSRGSSMMMEGIAELKDIARRWENLICVVAGFVAGTLLGFNGYMWSQSVIVEVYSFSVLSLMGVLVCLLRWIYAPHQRRYLYWAFFLFGICFTNHQTLIVAAMGIEVAIAAVDYRLGRSLFLWNSIAYVCGLILRQQKIILSDVNPMVFVIFNVVGILSIAAYVLFTIWTKEKFEEFVRDMSIVGGFALLCGVPLMGKAAVLFGIAALGAAIWFGWKTRKLGGELQVALSCGSFWGLGAAFYLYMPLAGMSIPPMQWGYPRTREGFIHAMTRGQYEKTNPTDFFGDPMRFFSQLQMFAEGVVDEFNWVYALLALVPFFFFSRMQKRERAWVVGITAIYLCLGVLLLILLNPPPDRQARELIRVFFTASHVMVAMGVGYGLTLIVATLAMHYEKARRGALLGGLIALDLAVFALAIITDNLLSDAHGADATALFSFLRFVFVALAASSLVLLGYRLFMRSGDSADEEGYTLFALGAIGTLCLITCVQIFSSPVLGIDQSTLAGFAKILCWLVAMICFYFAARPRPGEDRMMVKVIGGLLTTISLVLTVATLLGQQLSLAGLGNFFASLMKVFNPDQYALPVIAALILAASVLIFLAVTWFSRQRAPLAVALIIFALMPLHSFLSHWSENEQRGHLFGYWFGHDMFTPPFPGPDGKLSYDPKLRTEAMNDPAKGKFIYPEMTRDAILYGGTDPGRFCPTYMVFCEGFIPPECKPNDPLFDRRDIYIITQNALADGTYLNYIRSHYHRSAQKGDLPFFQEMLRSTKEREGNYETNFVARLALKLLDRPLTDLGAKIEARRRKEGVYPLNEMYIASPDDSQRCFQEYLVDAQRRLAHDAQNPNAPRQIKPGEDVKIENNRVQVSGQVAVMSINGLLTKVMFDKNPTNEFFVEESFPLDWMYPHLTPFGIIMKINRQTLPSLSEEVLQRDHDFWSRYSERLIGNWITNDTTVKQIADFVEKVYLKRDYSGFKGDRKFARDDNAQKAFSKLRSSIGGVYAWRIGPYCPPEYRPKSVAEVERIYKEADFTFRQAFAFCPYSPEAVFRYVNLLLQPPPPMQPRFDDALIVAETCLKLDPYNGQVIDLVNRLKGYRDSQGEFEKMRGNLQKMEEQVRQNPADYQAAFNLASTYASMQQPAQAMQVLDRVLNDPNADANVLRALLQAFAGMNNPPRLQVAVARLEGLVATNPVNFRAAVGVAEGYRYLKQPERAMQALDRAFSDPRVDPNAMLEIANGYAQLTNYPKLEITLERLVQMLPGEAEPYYDLAALKAGLGKTADALKFLSRAIEISAARRATNASLKNLAENARTDDRFVMLRTLPEFQKIVATK